MSTQGSCVTYRINFLCFSCKYITLARSIKSMFRFLHGYSIAIRNFSSTRDGWPPTLIRVDVHFLFLFFFPPPCANSYLSYTTNIRFYENVFPPDRYHGMKTNTHRYSRFRDISSGLCKFIDHLDKSEALDTENVYRYGNLSIKSTISNQGCDLIACTSLCT